MKDDREDGIEAFIFEYSLFLLTSARGTMDEPHTYGALRLLDGISRLTDLYSKSPGVKRDEFILGVSEEIQANLDKAMKSEEQFIRFMDELIVKFTDEMKRRYGSREI